MDWSSYHITGTCQDLEKMYLRMTSVSMNSIPLGTGNALTSTMANSEDPDVHCLCAGAILKNRPVC